MTAQAMTPVMIGTRTARRPGPASPARRSRVRVEMIQTPAAKARRRGVLMVLILAAVAIIAPQAFANDTTPPVVFDTYTVASGDTVWSIASDMTPAGVDVRDVVSDILTLNAMSSSGLQAGEQLLLPAVG